MVVVSLLATSCGSKSGDSSVGPTPVSVQIHDTLVAPDSNIRTGTYATGTESGYSAPYDDFTPVAAVTIRSVEWQGYYCNTAFTGSAIPDPVATRFIIRIAPNDGANQRPPFEAFTTTQTTAAYHVTSIAPSAVSQQLEFTRQDAACGARVGGDPAAYYRYSATLSSPYTVTAGTRYWIAIYATLPAIQVTWHWRFGREDNSFSIYWLTGTLTTFFGDRAYALHDR